MSENNLSDIISSLAANKEFASMVERVKESGDLGSIFGEVASLLGNGDGAQWENTSGSAQKEGAAVGTDIIKEAVETVSNEGAGGEGADTDGAYTGADTQKSSSNSGRAQGEAQGKAQEAGLLFGKHGGKGGDFDTSSPLFGLLPLFTRSITQSSALLIALKPYLSKKRCELIDSIIKISKLASIVSLAK